MSHEAIDPALRTLPGIQAACHDASKPVTGSALCEEVTFAKGWGTKEKTALSST